MRTTPVKNRTLDLNKRVRVYRNLRRPGTYSVMQDGLVVAHATELMLGNCTFIISRAGQLRVRREGRKNVHAFVEGLVKERPATGTFGIWYNPYKMDTFQTFDGAPVNAAQSVAIVDGKIWATLPYYEL